MKRSVPFGAGADVFRFDETTRCWLGGGTAGDFRYSDGEEVEQRLLAIVQAAADLSSSSLELRDRITDWPSRYHLSPLRANLLRPVADVLSGDLLELGAGCGALTRFLGERASAVVAVEGNPRRAAVAAARCRDLPAVQVVAESFHRCPPTPEFDAVTLIGVLEYARQYFPASSGDPVDALLRFSTRFLKPGGVLVLAIENQLGLKYLAGAPEDHLGEPMAGVEDRYRADGPVTFGKRELGRRLAEAGLSSVEWLYPFPDYKLPVSVLTERGLDAQPGLDLSPLLSASVVQDPQLQATCAFSLEQAWKPVFRNGLSAPLANSFLVVARAGARGRVETATLGYHYSVNRRKAFCKEAEFRIDGADVVVRRSLLYPEAPAAPGTVTIHLDTEPFCRGLHWLGQLDHIVNTPGWATAHVVEWARTWLDALVKLTEAAPAPGAPGDLPVSGRWIDAIPRNMIRLADGTSRFFDLEWRLDREVPLGYLVFRGLLHSFFELANVARPVDGTPIAIVELLDEVARAIDLPIGEKALAEYAALESDLQQQATGVEADILKSLRGRVLAVRGPLGANGDRADALARHVRDLEAHASGLSADRDRLGAEISAAHQALEAQAGQVDALSRHVHALEAHASGLSAERERLGRELEQARAGLEQNRVALGQFVAERDAELTAMRRSASWRLTRPLRAAKALIGRFRGPSA